VVDRFLTGLRNQGPGAIPALILSLLALGATVFWLLSRDDDKPTQTAEVVGAPASLTPTTATPTPQTTPAVPAEPGSGASGGGDDGESGGGGDRGGAPATVPVVPAPSDSGASSEATPPADQGGAADGGQGGQGNEPRSLDDIRQLLQGGNKPDGSQGSSSLPGVESLLNGGQGSDHPAPAPQSLQDLLDQALEQGQK